uniref:Tail protein n=1 Tax=viral metagenome TaxID=1070528 RepID=A0A6M3K9C7_9ZZZZ
MLLIEATINGTLHRLSMEGIALTNYWDHQIVGFDPLSNQLSNLYGGYVRPGIGGISFNHALFAANDWPPPVNMTIAAYYTSTTEAAKELLFSGIGHLANITRESIKYELYGLSYLTTIADATAFDDTLDNIVDWFCNAARLNLTVDHTYERVVSPPVKFTSSGLQYAINLLSDICAFNSHLFYISGSTLYLIDMLLDAGSQTITEFDFFPSEYDYQVPVAIASTTNYARTSVYPYGSILALATEFEDTEADINTALDNIITIMNRAAVRLKMPLLGSMPTPGKKISWTDTSLNLDLAAWIRARSIIYDFQNEEVIIEGEGALAAG